MNTNKIQKLLTIIVPCYNSEDYMKRCLDSLVRGGDKVEVIVRRWFNGYNGQDRRSVCYELQ